MSVLTLLILLVGLIIGIWAVTAFVSALIRTRGFCALGQAWLTALSRDETKDRKN